MSIITSLLSSAGSGNLLMNTEVGRSILGLNLQSGPGANFGVAVPTNPVFPTAPSILLASKSAQRQVRTPLNGLLSSIKTDPRSFETRGQVSKTILFPGIGGQNVR